MFAAVLFIALGAAILLNTLGLFNGTFWGFFWATFFIVVGLKMMMKKGKCPMCGWGMWQGKMHQKIHQKMGDIGDDCCGGQECCGDEFEECECGHDHQKEEPK